MKDSEKIFPLNLLEIAKQFKQEKTEKGKVSRKVLRMYREMKKVEKQNELNVEARGALRNFEKGIITKEELDQKFLPLESIFKKAMKKATPKQRR